MRLPAYLALSRHHIFYFRWPIPIEFHPRNRPSDIKVSLGTRNAGQALHWARQLCYVGETIARRGALIGMRYDEIRAVLIKHFGEALQEKKAKIAQDGPLVGLDVAALESSAIVAQHAIDTGNPIDLLGNDDALLGRFIKTYGLPLTPSSPLYHQFRTDFAAAFRDYCRAALGYSASLGNYDFSSAFAAPSLGLEAVTPQAGPVTTLKTAAEGYVRDSQAGQKWTPKTEGERSDHFDLLYEILGEETDIAALTKHQARSVKDLLMKLPKNRNKRKATRDLPLEEAVARADGETLNTTTINKYLQTYNGLFIWAERNGYVKSNLFSGLAIRKGKRMANSQQRQPFNDAQMSLILDELVTSKNGLIGDKKLWRKWGPLIGAFSGARLNEIAQLHVDDIKSADGIDYFDLNDEGERKSLKAEASKRRVPIHSTLIKLGFMQYVNEMRRSQSTRLFPEFTYCPCPSSKYLRHGGS
jgi:integrase